MGRRQEGSQPRQGARGCAFRGDARRCLPPSPVEIASQSGAIPLLPTQYPCQKHAYCSPASITFASIAEGSGRGVTVTRFRTMPGVCELDGLATSVSASCSSARTA